MSLDFFKGDKRDMVEGRVKQELLGVVVERQSKEIEDRIIEEAIREWDREGEGCFRCWLLRYREIAWWEIVKRN